MWVGAGACAGVGVGVGVGGMCGWVLFGGCKVRDWEMFDGLVV